MWEVGSAIYTRQLVHTSETCQLENNSHEAYTLNGRNVRKRTPLRRYDVAVKCLLGFIHKLRNSATRNEKMNRRETAVASLRCYLGINSTIKTSTQ